VGPVGVACDTSGNIYIGLYPGSSSVIKIDATTHATSTYLASGTSINGRALNSTQLFVIDASNNLYMADQGNNRVVKWSLTTNSFVASYPAGAVFSVAVDRAGNLWFDNYGQIYKIAAGSATGTTGTAVITSGLGGGITGLAFDSSNNLFVSDSNNNRVLKYTAASNYGTGTTVISSANNPFGLYLDSSNNLYVAETGMNSVYKFLASSNYATALQLSPNVNGAEGIGADSNGNLFLTAYGGGLAANSSVTEISQAGAGFGQVNVGTTSSSVGVNFEVVSGTTIGSFKVVDQGLTGKEFNLLSPDTNSNLCPTGTYAASTACTIDITFTPAYPGVRYGAVEALDGSGNVLATAFVSGTGLAPLVGFSPASVSVLNVTGLTPTMNGPRRGVFDPAGNLYVVDLGNNRLLEIAPNGAATVVSTPGITLNSPNAVALDGAGNLYIADGSYNRVVEITAAGAASVLNNNGLTFSPIGIAVDGAGNVYIADNQNGRVIEFPNGGSAYALTITGAEMEELAGIAVDGANNLYVGDAGNNRVLKITQGVASVVNTGSLSLSNPRAVTLDSPGNLYISDTGNNRMVEVPAGGGTPVVLSMGSFTLSTPIGAAVDGNGNLYIMDAGNNRIVVSSQENPPTLNFADTNVGSNNLGGPQTVTLLNLGNAPLVFSVPATGTNPALSPASFVMTATTCPSVSAGGSASSLAANSSCTYSIEFSPTTSGAISGGLTLTDNTMNVAGSQQQVGLSGKGISPATTTTVTSSVNPSVFGQQVTFTATVAPVSGSGTPSGTVTFLDGGTAIGTGNLNGSGIATFSTTTLAVGNHTITTSYPGDGTFTGSSGSLTGNPQVVNRAATTTAVTSTLNPSVFGQQVTFTATLTATAPGAGTPSGTVTFLDGGTAIGTGNLNGSGIATFSTTTLAAGNHTITTSYLGDGNFSGSTGSLTGNPQVVNRAVLTVTANNASMTYGTTPPTFTASYSGFVGSDTAATALSGAPSLTTTATSASAVSTYPIAAAVGTLTAANYSFAFVNGTLTITRANTTSVVTTNAATVLLKTTVTFTATVTSTTTGVPSSSVTFMDGTTSLGTGLLDGTGKATFSISTLTVGSHSITAVYGGDSNFNNSTSPAITESVQDFQFVINGTNVTGATTPVETQTVIPGRAATYVFQVSPTVGTIFPATVTLSVTGLPAGATYTITPSTLAAGSGSQSVTIVIQTAATVGSLHPQGSRMPSGVAFGLLLPAMGLLRLRRAKQGRSRRMALLALLLLVIATVGLVGCGASGYFDHSAQTYNLQLTGTSGALQHSTTFSLTIQ
jgi:sugar lactone lactonase YvrE